MISDNNNPHLLKKHSLFAMFCLSYFPLFLLLGLKSFLVNVKSFNYGGFNPEGILLFLNSFGFVTLLGLLSIYAFIGTHLTLRKIIKKKSDSFPVKTT